MTNPYRCDRRSASNLKLKIYRISSDSVNKDVCALGVFDVVCAARAGLISAGANVGYGTVGFRKLFILYVYY